MTRPPLIGIVAHQHTVSRAWGHLPVTGAPTAYAAAVGRAGGLPVLLPPATAPAALVHLDAVVLTGGGDVDPALYGGDPGTASEVKPDRDRAELAVVRAAHEARVPVFGVCRGLQVLVVAFGGSLDTSLGEGHLRPDTGHRVTTRPGSLVRSLIGAECQVSALHHQAVADPGPGWLVTARAADGVAEACEWSGPHPWSALGVQWHPELDASGGALFGWLVDTAQGRRRRPAVPAAV